MRSIRTTDLGMLTASHAAADATANTNPLAPVAAADQTAGGDALAAASLCGIVGGLIVGIAIAPAIPAVAIGSLIGAGVGVVVAYH